MSIKFKLLVIATIAILGVSGFTESCNAQTVIGHWVCIDTLTNTGQGAAGGYSAYGALNFEYSPVYASSGQSLSINLTGQIVAKFYFVPSVTNAALPATVSFTNLNNSIMCSGAQPHTTQSQSPELVMYDGQLPCYGNAWYYNPYSSLGHTPPTFTPLLAAATPSNQTISTYTIYNTGLSYPTTGAYETGSDISCTSVVNETIPTFAQTGTIMYNGVLSTYTGMATQVMSDGGPMLYQCTESLVVPSNIAQMCLGGSYGNYMTLANNGVVNGN